MEIASGAKLEVAAADESFDALEGEGEVEVNGRVTLSGQNSFAGTLSGGGVIKLAANARLALTGSAGTFSGYWDMSEEAQVVPPEGVTMLGGTFRPLVVSGAGNVFLSRRRRDPRWYDDLGDGSERGPARHGGG